MKDRLKIPTLDLGQCSVIMAELKTGHILTSEGRLFIETENPFRIFENFESAKAFCLAEIKRSSEIEFVINNESGEPILYLNSNENRKLIK